jgi:hypothetical protein
LELLRYRIVTANPAAGVDASIFYPAVMAGFVIIGASLQIENPPAVSFC